MATKQLGGTVWHDEAAASSFDLLWHRARVAHGQSPLLPPTSLSAEVETDCLGETSSQTGAVELEAERALRLQIECLQPLVDDADEAGPHRRRNLAPATHGDTDCQRRFR